MNSSGLVAISLLQYKIINCLINAPVTPSNCTRDRDREIKERKIEETREKDPTVNSSGLVAMSLPQYRIISCLSTAPVTLYGNTYAVAYNSIFGDSIRTTHAYPLIFFISDFFLVKTGNTFWTYSP